MNGDWRRFENFPRRTSSFVAISSAAAAAELATCITTWQSVSAQLN